MSGARYLNDFSEFYVRSDHDYLTALSELKRGQKCSHWIWYIFPQLQSLGSSPIAKYFGLKSVSEARTYLDDPVLGPRLVEISGVALQHLREGRTVSCLMGGSIDAIKLRSSATLFHYACPAGSVHKTTFTALMEECEKQLRSRDETTVMEGEEYLFELGEMDHGQGRRRSSSGADALASHLMIPHEGDSRLDLNVLGNSNGVNG